MARKAMIAHARSFEGKVFALKSTDFIDMIHALDCTAPARPDKGGYYEKIGIDLTGEFFRKSVTFAVGEYTFKGVITKIQRGVNYRYSVEIVRMVSYAGESKKVRSKIEKLYKHLGY